MSFSDIQRPSNRKFGFFLSAVFFLLSLIFYINNKITFTFYFIIIGLLIIIIAWTRSEYLLLFNIIWMRLGLFLGMIMNPIVLGLLFFGLFTPVGIIMRMFGRDELRLKVKRTKSHWVLRKSLPNEIDAFKRQF